MNLSYHLLYNLSLKDVIDIILVAIIFYYVFLLIKGTRAVQIAIGVGVLLLILALSYVLKLETTYWILHFVPLGLAILLPIVFQPELRRALSRLGREAMVRGGISRLSREKAVKVIDELIWASTILSQTRTGALIVFEKETGLQEFVRSGTQLNANVSAKLLISIFLPKSPLHDGAVIIRGAKVIAAGCYLPLSEDMALEPETGKELGTRHRAALGLSQQTDALVLVISEETGKISLAHDGNLIRNLEEENLKKLLLKLMVPPAVHKLGKPWKITPFEGKLKNAKSGKKESGT